MQKLGKDTVKASGDGSTAVEKKIKELGELLSKA